MTTASFVCNFAYLVVMLQVTEFFDRFYAEQKNFRNKLHHRLVTQCFAQCRKQLTRFAVISAPLYTHNTWHCHLALEENLFLQLTLLFVLFFFTYD